MRQKSKPFLSVVYIILFWAPLPIWMMLLLFGVVLVKFHALFSVLVALTPVFSFFIFAYYGIILLLRRTPRNKITFIAVAAITFVTYFDHWVSFGATADPKDIQIRVMTWNVQRLGALHNASVETNNLEVLSKTLTESKIDVAVIEEVSNRQLNRILKKMELNTSQALWTNYYNGSKGGLAVILFND